MAQPCVAVQKKDCVSNTLCEMAQPCVAVQKKIASAIRRAKWRSHALRFKKRLRQQYAVRNGAAMRRGSNHVNQT
jgi:hypothetical protein